MLTPTKLIGTIMPLESTIMDKNKEMATKKGKKKEREGLNVAFVVIFAWAQ